MYIISLLFLVKQNNIYGIIDFKEFLCLNIKFEKFVLLKRQIIYI